MQSVIAPMNRQELRDRGVVALDIMAFWKESPFDLALPMMPNGKTFGGNCEGCFWHSEYQNAMLCKQRPESVKWLIEQEQKMGHTFNDKFSFKEMAGHVETLPDSAFSDEEHFCMETNGSCGK